ncbi:hypothetical protein THAOC_21935, partial [Thalassiosira oceanica]
THPVHGSLLQRAGAGARPSGAGDGCHEDDAALRSTYPDLLRAERREHGAGGRGLERTEHGRLQELARGGRVESGERRAERREGRGVPGGHSSRVLTLD